MIERTELCAYTNHDFGLSTVKSLVERAEEIEVKAIAITDWNSAAAFSDMKKIAKRSSVKLIYGVTLWNVCAGEFMTMVTLLAKNSAGIKSIRELLSSVLTADGKRIRDFTLDDIEKYRENLLIGSVEKLFKDQDYLTASLELDPDVIEEILEAGEESGIPVAAIGEVYYSGPKDAWLLKALPVEDAWAYDSPLRSTEEMLARFNYLPKDIAEKIVMENPNRIAEMIE